ncbi:MAG: hypothetical protein MUF36_12620 [Bacteroidales bacterium]|nr:hypothetical protein [Bacteroidales bacterium]
MKHVFHILKFITGIILLILNVGIWINGLIITIERGMDIILATPILIAGAFLLLGWYKKARTLPTSKPQRWRFILNLLLINYAVLYMIYVAGELIHSSAIDFLNLPGIMLPLLMALFIMGFILSWKYENYAGIFFLLWYILAWFSQLRYAEIRDRGPYVFIGITIFIQGILYLVYYFRIKKQT